MFIFIYNILPKIQSKSYERVKIFKKNFFRRIPSFSSSNFNHLSLSLATQECARVRLHTHASAFASFFTALHNFLLFSLATISSHLSIFAQRQPSPVIARPLPRRLADPLARSLMRVRMVIVMHSTAGVFVICCPSNLSALVVLTRFLLLFLL